MRINTPRHSEVIGRRNLSISAQAMRLPRALLSPRNDEVKDSTTAHF